MLWVSLAAAGRVAWLDAVAAAFGGLLLWAFSFAVGFRGFSTGRQTNGQASILTLGLPLLLVLLIRGNLDWIAAFIPTAACYLPLKTGITESWAAGVAVTLAATIWLTDRGLSRCDRELRRWFDANQGRKTE